MYRWVIVGLLALVTTAGCSAIPIGPEPEPQSVPVMLVNNASQMETFTVGTVKEGSAISMQRRSGDSSDINVRGASYSLSTPTDNKIVDVKLPDSAHVDGRYRVNPGERMKVTAKNWTPDLAVFILVFDDQDGTYRAIHYTSCGRTSRLVGVRVTSHSEGTEDRTSITHGCG